MLILRYNVSTGVLSRVLRQVHDYRNAVAVVLA